MLEMAGPNVPDTQTERREFVRRVIALDPVMVLALYVAFSLELPNPFWAGASAAIVCQPQLGASLRKGWFIDPGLMSSLRMDRQITISILEFDPARRNESALEASWTISDTKSGPSLNGVKTYKARHVASTDHLNVEELVATMSALVAKMTDDIAATVLADE
jgi:hypothetical protein